MELMLPQENREVLGTELLLERGLISKSQALVSLGGCFLKNHSCLSVPD